MNDRMPPMDPASMNDAQRKAAAELTAGPRKGVFGPFIPLLRSPDLMDRLQRVGEYLRFNNTLPAKLNELAILITARRPGAMAADEAFVYDFAMELLGTHQVPDATYERAVRQLGEQGVIDLVGTIGYFMAICLVMNTARTPAPSSDVPPLKPRA